MSIRCINFTIQEAIDSLEDVIYYLETYDVTTVRASTPMYLMARYIKSMGIKMVLSGLNENRWQHIKIDTNRKNDFSAFRKNKKQYINNELVIKRNNKVRECNRNYTCFLKNKAF